MATTSARPRSDRVDRAVTGIRAAVGRLIVLLCDDDPATFDRAAAALTAVGPFAIEPLAAALGRAGSTRDRLVILGMMVAFGPRAPGPVMRALATAIKRERDSHVRSAAIAALDRLMLADALSPRPAAS